MKISRSAVKYSNHMTRKVVKNRSARRKRNDKRFFERIRLRERCNRQDHVRAWEGH
jgi:hypothetical protein